MRLYYDIPTRDQGMFNQKSQTEISTDDFKKLFKEPELSLMNRIIRFVTFIVFLGPIRILMFVLTILAGFGAIWVLCAIQKLIKIKRKAFQKCAFRVLYPFIRLLLFSLGIFRIKVKGRPNSEARIIISNHHALVDTLLIFLSSPCSIVAASFLSKNIVIKMFSKVFDFVFIDRSIKNDRKTSELNEIIANNNHLPVLIFPEGKVGDGEYLIGFRSGAFISDEIVQITAVRYRHWLIPKGATTIAWISDKNFEYFLQLFATPFYTAQVDYLPVFEWNSKEPFLRAREAQLALANHLGVVALSKTNRDLFQ